MAGEVTSVRLKGGTSQWFHISLSISFFHFLNRIAERLRATRRLPAQMQRRGFVVAPNADPASHEERCSDLRLEGATSWCYWCFTSSPSLLRFHKKKTKHRTQKQALWQLQFFPPIST